MAGRSGAISFTSQLKKSPGGKVFIVGLDGSELSFQAVQFAARMMSEYVDCLIVMTLGKSNGDQKNFDGWKGKAQDIAMKNGVPAMKISMEYVQIPQAFLAKPNPVIDAMVYLANFTANGSAVLVMGAAGKGDQDKNGSRPDGQPPMGSLATACLNRVKVPVCVVKTGPKINLDGVTRVKRQGRDGTPGLNFVVAVDGGKVSNAAFDQALRLAHRGDSIFGFHVDAGSAQTAEVEKKYSAELAKLVDTNAIERGYLAVVKQGHGSSMKEAIEDFAHEKKADVIVLGSIELSNATSDKKLGSVCMAVSRGSAAHVVVVKNYSHT